MQHDETRDNVTDIEATIIEADNRAILHQGLGGIEGSDKTGRETWDERSQRMAEEAEDVPDGESFPGDQCVDGGVPFHRPAGWLAEYVDEDFDGPEDDDDSEDDGQPSEYEEWQDYMGGDEYYDHSESVWGEGY